MKISELTKHINEVVKNKLIPLGFKKDGYGYTINENGFTSKIMFASVNRDNSFPTSFAVWFGFLGVDKILCKASGNDTELKKLKHGGQIFIRQQELFEQGKYPVKDYDIYTFEQANQAVNESLDYFLDKLIEQNMVYRKYEKMERRINCDEFIDTTRQSSISIRYGLILSKLVDNIGYDNLK